MLTEKNYIKVLSFFDNTLMEDQIDSGSGRSYYGLTLDWHFNNSVLCIDHLDVYDFFDHNGDFSYSDAKSLTEQYGQLPSVRYLKLIENILNILKHSTKNKEQNSNIIDVVIKVLHRDNVKVINLESGPVSLLNDDILDSGSYCNIVLVSHGIVRKELKSAYKDDESLQKRIKYEFENMQKLFGCPAIINVFDFNADTHSYHMEQCEKNLSKYIEDEMVLSYEQRLKIITDVLMGMAYAHGNDIIHRDLHLGNILKIGNDFVIADFGLSKDLSLQKSMKSSITPKNNHYFVDPLGLSDFTKLDQKSDVYSIGKIIDYVFTINTPDPNHIFKTVVERCISRNRDLRYKTAGDVLAEVKSILADQNEVDAKQNSIKKILNDQYDSQVHDFVIHLTENDDLSKFIVKYDLSTFWKLLLEFESSYQTLILQSISKSYAAATGHGGWKNYDTFAEISYNFCLQMEDSSARKIARSILEECANIRLAANSLLEKLKD